MKTLIIAFPSGYEGSEILQAPAAASKILCPGVQNKKKIGVMGRFQNKEWGTN